MREPGEYVVPPNPKLSGVSGGGDELEQAVAKWGTATRTARPSRARERIVMAAHLSANPGGNPTLCPRGQDRNPGKRTPFRMDRSASAGYYYDAGAEELHGSQSDDPVS